MEIGPFFYRIFVVDKNMKILRYRGTTFPITPGGGFLTCRHVLDVNLQEDESLAILDNETHSLVRIEKIIYPSKEEFDMAFLPNALKKPKEEFFPILTPEEIIFGEDVYSFGYFDSSRGLNVGYFKGNIVNFLENPQDPDSISLSYAVIEGLSGSPVLTYCNGVKVVGL
ncbi:MAG: trypsin-like peptidase domain-containing protein, partial [Verrucomicrobiae bacterium]|nr:trypsin-like peptidase domain-containing protein [Verrucomicrobiae bacterium]